jgi:DNA-binding MarR family transcriptional regulator
MSPRRAVAEDAPDAVDAVLDQWRRERPELDVEPMGTVARLGRVAGAVEQAVAAELRRHGLSIGEFDVLAALRRAGAPHTLSPTELARTVVLSPGAMTNRLDRLEEDGLISRRLSKRDRRSFDVTLTPSGLERVDAAVSDHVANEARLLAALSPTERRRLDAILRRLLTARDAS